MEFVQLKRRVRGMSNSVWWCKPYSAIWSNSREHSKNAFAVSLGYGTMYMNFDEKHSPNVLENQTRLQITPPERASFAAYTALHLNKFHRVLIGIF